LVIRSDAGRCFGLVLVIKVGGKCSVAMKEGNQKFSEKNSFTQMTYCKSHLSKLGCVHSCVYVLLDGSSGSGMGSHGLD
jgi:hypothetical protein